ncbi:hypothetical protein ACFQ17_06950 [Oceanobacillus picturae]
MAMTIKTKRKPQGKVHHRGDDKQNKEEIQAKKPIIIIDDGQ